MNYCTLYTHGKSRDKNWLTHMENFSGKGGSISERIRDAGEYVPHRLGRLSLSGAGHMGVGVQGKLGGKVTQHPGCRPLDSPAQAQRSGLRRKRLTPLIKRRCPEWTEGIGRSHAMSEPCPYGMAREIWSRRRRGGAYGGRLLYPLPTAGYGKRFLFSAVCR